MRLLCASRARETVGNGDLYRVIDCGASLMPCWILCWRRADWTGSSRLGLALRDAKGEKNVRRPNLH